MPEETPQSNPERLLFDVWLVSRATTALLDGALAPVGLTADEFALHSTLHHAGPLTPSQLAEILAIPPTTVSTHIRRLERRGNLARIPHPEDGRSALLRLTAAGEETYHQGRALFLPVHHRIVEVLTLPVADARAALTALDRAVRQVRGEREATQGHGSPVPTASPS